jgi:hypothetical protein
MLGEMRGQLTILTSLITAADKSRGEMRVAIEADINALREQIVSDGKARAEEAERRFVKIEERIGKVESKMTWAAGAAFPIGFLIATFADRVISWIWPA